MISAAIARYYATPWGPAVPFGICTKCGKDTDGSGQLDQDRDLTCPDCADEEDAPDTDRDPCPPTLKSGRPSPWENCT